MPKTEEEKVQEGMEKTLAAAGFQEGTPPVTEETAQEMPPSPAETPVVEPEKSVEPTAISPEEFTRLQDENKALKDKAEWADRAQKAADRERQRAEKAEADAERFRVALGAPPKTTERILTPQEQEQDEIGMSYMRAFLPRALREPEVVAAIPEEALTQHPAMKKMSIALWMVGEELEKSRFVAQFDSKHREGLEKEVIPEIQRRRQASGFKKTYNEAFEEMEAAAKTVAAVRGITLPTTEKPGPPPAAPPFPSAPAPTIVPPSLSGVSGGGPPSSGSKPTVLDLQTARFLGVKGAGGA